MSRDSFYQMSAMLLLQPQRVTDSLSHFGKLLIVMLNSAFTPRNPNVPKYMLPWLAQGLQVCS